MREISLMGRNSIQNENGTALTVHYACENNTAPIGYMSYAIKYFCINKSLER